jgi:hypothetical protein
MHSEQLGSQEFRHQIDYIFEPNCRSLLDEAFDEPKEVAGLLKL